MAARGERGVPAEQWLRDMRINRIFEGSSEIMRLFIAREAVDAHLAAAGELIEPGVPAGRKARAAAKAGGFYAKWLPTLVAGKGQQPGAYNEFGPLAGHLRYVERTSRKLARATFYGMARWQGKLERKQGFLGRIVDIGAELYAMSAACIRAQLDATDEAGTGRGSTGFELAGAFCAQARLRCDELFGQLWANTDAADSALSRAGPGRALHLAGGRHHRPVHARRLGRRRPTRAVEARQRAPARRLTAAGADGRLRPRRSRRIRVISGANPSGS